MLSNYIKVALRNLLKHQVFSIINIFGLAFGLCCALLIALWVHDEYSFDKFHTRKERIFLIVAEIPSNMGSNFWNNTPGPLADVLKKDFAGIERTVRVTHASTNLFKYGDERIEERGIYADPEILEVFDFPLVQGSREKALNDPHSLLLTEEFAHRIFGETEPLGQVVTVGDMEYFTEYTVTGVLKDIPAQSRLQFDYIMPYEIHLKHRPWNNEWINYNETTYVLLREGSSRGAVSKKIENLLSKHADNSNKLHLYPMKDLYLVSNFSEGLEAEGRIKYVRLFSTIGVIILLIACINFMNLATARAGQRAKEVGIRKATGAYRTSLIGQFLGESVLIAVISGILAVTMGDLLLNAFNTLTEKSIVMPYADPYFTGGMFLVCVITGVIAGIYPAFYLSAFEPGKVLKGAQHSGRSLSGLRKGLVIVQFTLSIIFVITTLFVHDQMLHMLNKDLGLDKENIVYHNLHSVIDNREAYRHDILSLPGVREVSLSNSNPLWIGNTTYSVKWKGKPEGDQTFFHAINTGHGFVNTFRIRLLDGRHFPETYDSTKVMFMVNEQAALAMGLTDPVGEVIELWGDEGEIIGLMKDFHHQSMFQKIEPVIIYYRPENTWRSYIALDGHSVEESIAGIKSVYLKYEENYPFEYDFVDVNNEKRYGSVAKVGTLSGIFAMVAIFVSCLGLFGLSSYMTERRRKEAGIRKVFGASVAQLAGMFSGQFLRLIIISFVAGVPVAWYLADQWLSQFEYRTSMDLVPFVLGGASALLVSVVTVSYHIIRTALGNPADILRYE